MNNFRIRVSGILIENGQILLVQQETSGRKYSIPGGGVDFDESIDQALVREFKEETGITIGIKNIAYISEYFKDKSTHVVEIAFNVFKINPNEEIVVGSEKDSTSHPITGCQMVPVDELEKYGMERPARLLKDQLIGFYSGLRDK